MRLAMAVLGCVAAIDAAQREYRFGGPPRLILVAGPTAGVIMSVMLVAVFAIRGAVGSPPLRFPHVVVVVGTFGTLVAYVVGWWKRDEAAVEAEVREERARRGIDGVASGLAGSDPGRGLWAYLFFLALGGFGLLLTAFVWTKNPDWPYVALGVGINGPLVVWGLVGVVRARASGS
jgi:hypothetical protein